MERVRWPQPTGQALAGRPVTSTGDSRPAQPSPGLAAGALRGVGWNVVTFAVAKGLLLVTTVVLARLLPPSEFGLLALGLLVVLFFDLVGDLGIGAAVIYRRASDDRSTSTAAVLAAGAGTALTALCVLTAPLLDEVFDEPRLPGVVQVLALGLLVRSFSSVHRAVHEKHLDFGRRALPEILGALTKASLSIGLALGGLGVYSLAWGQVGGMVVTTVLYWLLARWRFRWVFDRGVARELMRFGLPVTLLAVLAAVTQSLDQLIIGQRLDATALGQYSIAFRLPEFLVLHFCYLLSGALFPSYAKASHDADQLRRGFRLTMRLVSVVTVPVALGLAATAGQIIPLLFGQQWSEAVPVMRWLAIGALLVSLSFNVGDVYKATGRPGVLNLMTLARLVVSAPVLWFVAPRGVVAIAATTAVLYAINAVFQLVVASRLMQLPVSALLAEFVPAATAGAAMLIVLLPASALIAGPDLVRLLILVVLGAVSYVGALCLTSRSTVRQVTGLVRGARGRVLGPAS